MGLFRRRAVEKVRQTANIGDKDFDTTSKTRVQHSYDELKPFAKALESFEADAKQHLHHTREFNRSTKTFLATHLPRMHEEIRPGESRALERKRTVGDGADPNRITEAGSDRYEEIFHDALEPIKKWLLEYSRVTKDMTRVEKLRLEQDNRRRTVRQQEDQEGRLRNKFPSDHPKLTKHVENKQRQIVKTQQAQEEFDGQEEAVYKEMQALCDKAKGVQAHVIKFHDHIREMSEHVVNAFHNDHARIHAGGSGTTPMTHGQIANSTVTPVVGTGTTAAGTAGTAVKQVGTGTPGVRVAST